MSERSIASAVVAVTAALALAGCAAAGGDPAAHPSPSFSFPPAEAPAQSSPATTDSSGGSPITDEEIAGAADALNASGTTTFEDGSAFAAEDEVYWNLSSSTLSDHGFEMDAAASDLANGRWSYVAADGATIVALQQRVRDIDPAQGDEEATREILSHAGLSGDPRPASFGRSAGGEVQALAGELAPGGDGRPVGLVSRTFARTGINLTFFGAASGQDRLTETLDVAKQAVTVGIDRKG
ncbi:hypothetical protein [Rathayibacter tanaceti]|uniref:Lipoprotein LpqN n=2 Tax=Rathayibacter tanaceti TaxID=1671680 RepID=A0A166ICV0_9MICO|nr:hypothetical protein [Rathayibacter tanaceti]KZX22172.1 hypothetical protein ACH61_00658 [Rathayibacter tanaceti]QHC55068.1 hypothetical protein GSU10_05080 [Rathayibacter tanaceti]TCO33841.1 hypothetical protein EV639_11356 [Rathayibacter tanaceti]